LKHDAGNVDMHMAAATTQIVLKNNQAQHSSGYNCFQDHQLCNDLSSEIQPVAFKTAR